jgi:hypothetical protein
MLKSEDHYRNFKQSIKSKDLFLSYDGKLKAFMKHRGFNENQYSQLIEGKDIRQIEADIIDFIIFLKERHYSLASQKAYLSALIDFFSINDLMIRRKKISKFLSNDDIIVEENYDNNSSDSSNSVSDSGNSDKLYTH